MILSCTDLVGWCVVTEIWTVSCSHFSLYSIAFDGKVCNLADALKFNSFPSGFSLALGCFQSQIEWIYEVRLWQMLISSILGMMHVYITIWIQRKKIDANLSSNMLPDLVTKFTCFDRVWWGLLLCQCGRSNSARVNWLWKHTPVRKI